MSGAMTSTADSRESRLQEHVSIHRIVNNTRISRQTLHADELMNHVLSPTYRPTAAAEPVVCSCFSRCNVAESLGTDGSASAPTDLPLALLALSRKLERHEGMATARSLAVSSRSMRRSSQNVGV